jgi:hypothetical protein
VNRAKEYAASFCAFAQRGDGDDKPRLSTTAPLTVMKPLLHLAFGRRVADNAFKPKGAAGKGAGRKSAANKKQRAGKSEMSIKMPE